MEKPGVHKVAAIKGRGIFETTSSKIRTLETTRHSKKPGLPKANGRKYLMNAIVRRPYEGEKDFEIMLELMARARPAAHAADYPAKVDIEENLSVEKIRATVKLWFDDGRLIGWAYVDDGDNLRWELEKSYVDIVGAEIVAWGADCIRAAGENSTLDASCREDYKERLDFLKQHGFRQTENYSIRMKRDLSQPIPNPELPPGYLIRPVKGIEEAEAIAATHRAAFRTDYMTTENRLVIMNSSEYDPALDLLVIAPDGMIAGCCTCSAAPDGGGFTDPVAVHPSHQRKGLSKALLLKGLQALKERGMNFAYFTASGDNISMQKAGESAGFVLESKNLWFEKEVRN
jgi:GNAT superfamily N-acetyltransferase